ncbi:MFS transporter [Nocardia sp. NPDC050710]|uniref:MFS transporter n=1 Tax=Nocardia sp. NPDC050710 TaxID=3157220 RepID=UPI0033CDFE1E
MIGSGARVRIDFALLWSGNAVSLIGFHGTRIAAPLLVLSLTGSPAAAGWVGFAVSAPSLLFRLVAGEIVDRYDRLRILRICQTVGLLTACAVAAAVLLDAPALVPLIVLAAFVEGAVYVFVDLAELGAICDIVPEDQRPAAFSFLEAEQPVASLLGRAVGGAIYGLARWLPFVIDAASYLYCLVALSLIRRDPAVATRSAEAESHTSRRDLAVGLRMVWNEPVLRTTTAAAGASNMIIQLVLLLILFELGSGTHPTWTAGVVLAAAGVGGILGAAVAARLTARFQAFSIYRAGLWIWTAVLLPIALSDNPIVLAVCWGGVGAVGVAGNVAMTIYRVEVIPEHILGRAAAAVALVADAAVALGALGAGYLLTAMGVVPVRWMSFGLMFALACAAGIRRTVSVSATAPVG